MTTDNKSRDELMSVDWAPETREWTVYARPSAEQDWATFDGAEGELWDLLALAHDVVTGG